ncbi:hypothetical protein K6W26_16605 [Burkholderia sp. AU42008]|uniref:hypothetical protein n=1 Tax=unclassified Burkholderia TaxID=2613784 RepID=UPI001177E028|nr:MULTISPECIES: hypothetical protein [unclassified Burkholderia]MBR8237037.1 hypothetical protein [Burkholderia sp. AU32357]MBY4874682.1 hypothetical protein [Burkholderia sp. AU42008]
MSSESHDGCATAARRSICTADDLAGNDRSGAGRIDLDAWEGNKMIANWSISATTISRWKRLVEESKNKDFAIRRRARNVKRSEALDLSEEEIWRVLVGCNVTTQQRSGPKSAASKFLHSDSPALNLERCRNSRDVQRLIETECTRAGLRRSVTIAKNLAKTLNNLQKLDGWAQLQAQLATLEKNTTSRKERQVADYLRSGDFPGLGQKQARNFIQWIGLSRYEVPLDSRVLKRLREFGANFVPRGSAMTDEAVYLFVQDLVQRIATELDIYPCELDACIFASFGDDEPAIEAEDTDTE